MVILLVILFVIGIYIQQKMTHDLQVEGTAAGKEIVVYQVEDVTKDKFEECWADAEYETNCIFDVETVFAYLLQKSRILQKSGKFC